MSDSSPEWFDDHFDVSRETLESLTRYVALLTRWTQRINLISAASLANIWVRHIADSAQLMPLIPSSAQRILDIGSGAGLPGLVITIMARQSHQNASIYLCESDTRKAAFLSACAAELSLPVQIVPKRIEAVPPMSADVITARALAPLTELLHMAEIHQAPDAICLFPKGRWVHNEIEAARRDWTFDVELVTSLTNPEAAIVKIEGFAHG